MATKAKRRAAPASDQKTAGEKSASRKTARKSKGLPNLKEVSEAAATLASITGKVAGKKKTRKKRPTTASPLKAVENRSIAPVVRPASRTTDTAGEKPDTLSGLGRKNARPFVVGTRHGLGVTQELFARLIGVSQRSVAGWEAGTSPINESAYRRIRELARLADSLKKVMKPGFIPTWLVTPNEGMGGISPVEALERGENDRFWRSVFLMGSGLPL